MSPSDYEMIEQGYDPPPRMPPLERVEEIVARCETYQYSLPRDEQRALIASWRERGAENASLKVSVMAFLAPWAVRYAEDHELDGLHPTHYDILERCGARMVDFKRAALKDKP